MFYSFQLDHLEIKDEILEISLSGTLDEDSNCPRPRLSVNFYNRQENRRMPLIVSAKKGMIQARGAFQLEFLFWDRKKWDDIHLQISLMCGETYLEKMQFDFDDDRLGSDHKYYDALSRGEGIIIQPLPAVIEHRKTQARYASWVSFFSYIKFAVSIILIPLLAVKAYYSSRNASKRSPDFKRARRGYVSFLYQLNWEILRFSGHGLGRRRFNLWIMAHLYQIFRRKAVKKNQVAFISERRNDLTGNFQYLYEYLNHDPGVSIVQFLKNKPIKSLTIKEMWEYVNILATSRVILLDDFMPSLNVFKLKDETCLIQLWHAVGAFKTFGFSRIEKEGGPEQFLPNHRYYDRTIVSSKEVSKFYAEGFGLSDEKVVATGIPRTDVFFKKKYKQTIQNKFYQEYPYLKDKKIILFAPTFRGNGIDDAYYPLELFDLNKIYSSLDGDYALIVKHHPFVKEKIKIPSKFKDNIVDLSSNSEINDLLFVTDILVTDYSSVIFEAALLDIPMIFYAYDLEEYIHNRDFYYEYQTFVPGKIVKDQEKLIKSVLENDFHKEKMEEFKKKYFDYTDGKSTERVLDIIYQTLNR